MLLNSFALMRVWTNGRIILPDDRKNVVYVMIPESFYGRTLCCCFYFFSLRLLMMLRRFSACVNYSSEVWYMWPTKEFRKLFISMNKESHLVCGRVEKSAAHRLHHLCLFEGEREQRNKKTCAIFTFAALRRICTRVSRKRVKSLRRCSKAQKHAVHK